MFIVTNHHLSLLSSSEVVTSSGPLASPWSTPTSSSADLSVPSLTLSDHFQSKCLTTITTMLILLLYYSNVLTIYGSPQPQIHQVCTKYRLLNSVIISLLRINPLIYIISTGLTLWQLIITALWYNFIYI